MDCAGMVAKGEWRPETTVQPMGRSGYDIHMVTRMILKHIPKFVENECLWLCLCLYLWLWLWWIGHACHSTACAAALPGAITFLPQNGILRMLRSSKSYTANKHYQ